MPKRKLQNRVSQSTPQSIIMDLYMKIREMKHVLLQSVASSLAGFNNYKG